LLEHKKRNPCVESILQSVGEGYNECALERVRPADLVPPRVDDGSDELGAGHEEGGLLKLYRGGPGGEDAGGEEGEYGGNDAPKEAGAGVVAQEAPSRCQLYKDGDVKMTTGRNLPEEDRDELDDGEEGREDVDHLDRVELG
jgi:hypothetical protein